jgi:putative two-component system response regulator
MEQHPLYGERICRHLQGFEHVLPIVRHHHEWWDGSGYPDGLVGARIPFLARVFQVVDVYDALLSRRVYKNSLSSDRALDVLREEAAAGKWDPKLVKCFCDFVHHGLLGAVAGCA